MSTDQADAGHAGVFQTLRQMPRYTRFALLGVFVNQLGAFLQAFMVLYLTYRGFSESEAALALGAYAVGGIVGTIGGGWFTDRLGTRLTISVAVTGAALMTLSVTVLPSISLIVGAVFLAGGLTLVSRPAVTALLLKSVPEARQVMVQAMFRTALNGGAAFGPMLAAWLSTIHWNLVFYVEAAAAISYGLIALFLFPRKQEEQVAAKSVAETATESADSAEAPKPAGAFLSMIRDVRYAGYLLLMFGNGVIHIQFYAVLPLMVEGQGMPTWVYSSAITASATLVITTELLITKVTQKWAIWAAVLIGWLLFIGGRGALGLFELVTGASLVVVMLVLVTASMVSGLGQIIGGPAAFAYPARVAPTHAVGTYVGGALGSFQIGYAVGPIVGVWLWHQVGGPFWGLLLIVGLALSGLLVWSMRAPLRARSSSAPAPAAQSDDPAPASATK